MSLTLSDALSHYRSASDATHKFWGYFQAVAAGTAAFAWSKDKHDDSSMFVVLGVAFTVFAMINWLLVVSSQKEARIASACVKEYANSQGISLPSKLAPIIQAINPYHPAVVGVWHAVISFATLYAIWWRYKLLFPCD